MARESRELLLHLPGSGPYLVVSGGSRRRYGSLSRRVLVGRPPGSVMEGTSVGKYQIRSVIGRGAIGIVYEAWDPVLARKVAVKVLPLLGTDEDGREKRSRFLREAQAAASLCHPNIVGVYDYGETQSSAYIVMELISGRPLEALLERGVRLPVGEVATIMDGLLAGLQHSHERGVVHRDIKPGNIVVAADGTIKITDFGIAHLESSDMTQLGSMIGTPAYMSPEQVLGERVNARTDIYSAAVVLYRMLLGVRPFEGSVASIMHRIVNAQPSLPPDLLTAAPSSMGAILAKALSKRPEERYTSAREFARVLREEFGGARVSTPEKDGPEAADATVVRRPSDLIPPDAIAEIADVARGPPLRASLPSSETVTVRASEGTGHVEGAEAGPRPSPRRSSSRTALRVILSGSAACLLVGGAGWWVLGSLHRPAKTTVADATPSTPALPVTPGSSSNPTGQEPRAAGPQSTLDANEPSSKPLLPTLAPSPARGQAAEPLTLPGAAPRSPEPPGTPALAVQTALNEAAATLPCSLVFAAMDGRGDIVLNGLTALGDASELQVRAALQRVIALAAPSTPIVWNMRRIEGPYCAVLDVLRLARSGGAGSTNKPLLSLAGQAAPLTEGQAVELDISAPDTSAALLLDYFAPDRSVTHLLPRSGETTQRQGPDTPIGDAGAAAKKLAIPVQVLHRAGLITAVVAPAPLLTQGRPTREAASTYLDDLRRSLDRARDQNLDVAIETLILKGAPQ